MSEEYEITEEEIQEHRNRHLKGEEFSGKVEASGLASFAKVLQGVGFSNSEVLQLLLKKMDNERDIQISYIQKEMNENMAGVVEPEEVCDCNDCKSERGEGKEPTL